MNTSTAKLDWMNICFLTLSPFIALLGGGLYTFYNGIHPIEVGLFVTFYFLTGLSITGGYHRYFAHVSYECHPVLKLFYLIFGACALENTALRWASDHRYHHRYTDTEKDPYNIREGFWHAHMGWILFKRPRGDSRFDNIKDLLKDPMIRWQDRYYLLLAIAVGFGIPTLIGLAIDRPLGGLLWGGFLRVVLVHHTTFLVNSAAHTFGSQPYANDDSSRDCWWVALLTNGEGYHNSHHKFPGDYRNGRRWFQYDPTKWLVWSLSRLGITRRLNRTSREAIMQTRVPKHFGGLSEERWASIHAHLESGRHRLELATRQLTETKSNTRN